MNALMRVSVVHSGGTGHTAEQASAVAEGVRSVPGAECRLVNLSTDGVPWEVLESSAAIVFGSPAAHGTVDAEVKRFFEDSTTPVWLGLRWRDKVAAGFTSSGAGRGDELGAIVTMSLFAARHGMVWVGLDLPSGNGERPSLESDLRAAAYLGRRVADIAWRMHSARSKDSRADRWGVRPGERQGRELPVRQRPGPRKVTDEQYRRP